MSKPDFIKVDEKILKSMTAKCWCDLEQPLVAMPMEFKQEETQSYTKGYILITRGAHYIFKNKVFKSADFVGKFNLLEVKIVHYMTDGDNILFELENTSYFIKTEDVGEIASATSYVLNNSIYGIKDIHTFEINVKPPMQFPNVKVTERPEDALKWRAIFLAHFYDLMGDQLFTVDYFNKWESKKNHLMTIGPSLHPGNFACAYGHSIGWELLIKTVVFQNFAPSKFSGFFEALVTNAIAVKKMVFMDYQKSEKYPHFPDSEISRSSVKKYQFINCIAPVILNFFEFCRGAPQIESLIVSKATMNSEEFSKMAELANKNEAMIKTTKFFELAKTKIEKLPMRDMTSLLSAFSALETVAIRNMSGDGSRFLNAIGNSSAPIRFIHINMMNFRRPLKSDCKFSPTLLHVDVSFCAFTEEAYMTLLIGLTKAEMATPIIFESISITVAQPQTFELIGQLDFDNCCSNIAEFDYSGNKFPDESSRYLFAFLFTQKNLRLLSLNSVECGDPVDFLKNVMTLMTAISLPGVELSGNFDNIIFAQFLTALSTQEPLYIRKLSLKNTKSGAEGLMALTELVSKCPNLNEISADGFKSDSLEALVELWQMISKCESISSCDYPVNDFKNLKVVLSKLSQSDQKVFKIIEEKNVVSTTGKRDEFNANEINNGKKPTVGPELFLKCADFGYKESVNDFASKEFALKQSE